MLYASLDKDKDRYLKDAKKEEKLKEELRELQVKRRQHDKSTRGADYTKYIEALQKDLQEEKQATAEATLKKLQEAQVERGMSRFDLARKRVNDSTQGLADNLSEAGKKELKKYLTSEFQRIDDEEAEEKQAAELAEKARLTKQVADAQAYLNQLTEQEKLKDLSPYERRRIELEKTVAELKQTLTTEQQLADIEAYRQSVLKRIADDEAAAAQKVAEEEARAAQKAAEEKQKAVEQAEKEAKASAERVAAAEKRLTDATLQYQKLQEDKALREQRDKQNRQIQSLQNKIKGYDKQLASFGFSLSGRRMKRRTSASERNEIRRNLKLDESISEKQAAQARGENVHFTNREWRRIREAEKIRDKKEQAQDKIEAIKASQASQDAARAAQAAAERQEAAAKAVQDAATNLDNLKNEQAQAVQHQKDAADALKAVADSLNPQKSASAEDAVPVVATAEGVAATATRTVGKAKGAVVARSLPAAPPMASTGNDVMTPLDTIITLLQKLQSNVYIAR